MKRLIATLAVMALLSVSASAYHIDYPNSYTPYYNHNTATALAKLVWAEGRGVKSDTEKAAIMWCVINRVEAGYGTLWQVITAPNQFAYRESAPVDPALYELAKDVLIRWDMERCGHENVGRVLPKDYLWFTGSNGHNWFRDAYKNGNVWRWELPSPYES